MNTSNASDFIDDKGGPAIVAQMLRLTSQHAVQRVSNWRRRGIPLSVLVAHPKVFGPISKCQNLLAGSDQVTAD